MPDLTHSLQGRDLGHLRIIAEHWGLELNAPDTRVALQRLAPALLEPALVAEVVEALPQEARAALADLLHHTGRLPWAHFTRRYGEIRKMGPARRDRERPDRTPASPAETLWYHALVARNFLETPAGPQEFAYLPEDLIPLLPHSPAGTATPLGRPASPAERALPLPATDEILDEATTLLAALRLGLEAAELEVHLPAARPSRPEAGVLRALLAAAGLLASDGAPRPEPARAFLEAPRGEALAMLARAWIHAPNFNELRLMPGLVAEGEWANDPLSTRHALLDFISSAPAEAWWSLPAFLAAIEERHPDFQRPAGDYDTWYLRAAGSEEYLRGFEHWDEVDGALARWVITGPMHWLGLGDLAVPEAGGAPSAFRFSAWAAALSAETGFPELAGEEASFHLRSDRRINAPRLAPRAARYQLARFASWEAGGLPHEFRYRFTPSALARAAEQGLRVDHLLALLRRHTQGIPPNLTQALKRWESHGAEARVETLSVLRVGSPEVLQALVKSRAARFLGDPLGPTTVVVKVGAEEKVLDVLAELGWLGEIA